MSLIIVDIFGVKIDINIPIWIKRRKKKEKITLSQQQEKAAETIKDLSLMTGVSESQAAWNLATRITHLEDKKTAINQLKIDLISRFYSFSSDEIIKYKTVLNFDRDHLMENESILWNKELIETVYDKLDWTAIWKLKNIILDIQFFKKYETLIDYDSIHLSKNIVWNEELIDLYGDKFRWDRWLITIDPLSKIKYIRRFKDKLDWSIVSEKINLSFDDDIIGEFENKWVWKKLSLNKHLPLTIEFIQKYGDKLDFDELSKNPTCLPIILKYPASDRWNWKNVIVNPGIVYTQELFDIVFSRYKRHFDTSEYRRHLRLKNQALLSFLNNIFSRQTNDISFFLGEYYIKLLPWKYLSKRYYRIAELNFQFIKKHKEKLNFKEGVFVYCYKDIITTKFIWQNHELFNTNHYQFYTLPLTRELIINCFKNIDYNYLSNCDRLDWTWDFIEEHFYDLHLFKLSRNIGIYNRVILKTMTHDDIFNILDIGVDANQTDYQCFSTEKEYT